MTKAQSPRYRFFYRIMVPGFVVCLGLFYIFCFRPAAQKMRENSAISKGRDLVIALFQYAQDNHGQYPEGKNSTEVFQKLLDGGYLVGGDSGDNAFELLYMSIPGKVKAPAGTKVLKPENVCWDVTGGASTVSPEKLPLLILTGYRVTYRAGARAHRLPHPPRSWSDWWEGKAYPDSYVAVSFVGNNSTVMKVPEDGTTPEFIPSDVVVEGAGYHQLIPTGELEP